MWHCSFVFSLSSARSLVAQIHVPMIRKGSPPGMGYLPRMTGSRLMILTEISPQTLRSSNRCPAILRVPTTSFNCSSVPVRDDPYAWPHTGAMCELLHAM